jgi:drug/metabolite transporter (DMT)-like permease
MSSHLGELAGLLTSLLYTLSATFITRAVQKVGAVTVNRGRVVFASIYLLIINLFLFGQPLPLSAGADRWTWLSLSGLIGLALGDAFLFQSFAFIGPRLGSLIFALSTVFGSVAAWMFFGETLSLLQITGIALALGGILWVVLDHRAGSETSHSHVAAGVTYAALGALAQAAGYILAKQGMLGNFPPFQASIIRMSAAALGLWVMAAFQKQVGGTIQTLRQNLSALKFLALASLIGSVLGVTASLYAVQHAEVGVASVLTSLSPVFLLPVSHFVFKERIGWQSIAGTFLAMVGVSILFLK